MQNKTAMNRLFFIFSILFVFFFIPNTGQSQILAWNLNGALGSETSIDASTKDVNLNTSSLTRGAGITATALANAFSGNGWNVATETDAITGNKYFQFTINASTNYKVSLSTLDVFFRRSSTGPNTFQWKYSLDGFASAGINIGGNISYTGTNTNGDAQSQISLSGIAQLQNVVSPATITIRLYGWGATGSTGTFAIGRPALSNSLSLGGTVAPASSSTPIINVIPSSLTNFSTTSGAPSASQSFTANGANLTDNILVSPSSQYEVSLNNSTFSSTVTLNQSGGTVNNTTVYVRIKSSASPGVANGTVTLTAGTASNSVSLSGTVVGLITLAASPYTQNFNGIGSGLPTGITTRTGATASAIGSEAAFATTAALWNNTGGGFKNFASGNNDQGVSQNTATDRAVGVRQTGSLGDPGAAFVFQIANTSGKINFTLDFNLQSLDASSPRITTWQVDYGFGVNPSSFIVPATTGILTTGGSTFSNNPIHVDFGNTLDNKSGIITIRIVTLSGSAGSGNRASTGIDDFTLTWEDPSAKTFSLDATALNFPVTNINNSNTLSYKIVSQTNLDQPIEIETTAPYTISTDNVNFFSNLSVAPADAFNKTIYVKFAPVTAGVYPGTITHTSVGAVPKIINLSGEAVDPNALSFNFNTCSVSNIPGSGFLSINITGSQKWKCSQFGRNGTNGADVNGFVSGSAQTNDAWLISPALNLNNIVNLAVLSFYSRGEFTGPKLQLYVSTTYDGSSVPNLADWTELNGNFPTPPGSATTAWTFSDNIDLSAYKAAPKVYIAFRYTSSAALNAARWSVDDIAISDQSTLLTVSPTQLDFGEISVGANSLGQAVSFKAIGSNDLTLTPPAGYEISADNSSFTTTSIIIDQATAAAGTTFYVRFSPTIKALKIEGNINVTADGLNKDIVALTGSSFPKSETFDVAAYNISFFGAGSANNATPEQIATQVANISTVVQKLNADVIGIEEMSNDAALAQLVGTLPGYTSVISNRWSYSFNPPDPDFPPQKIGFIYNTATMSLSSEEPPRVMFESLYDSARLNLPGHRLTDYPTGNPSSFWASGRLPFISTFDATIDGVTKKVRVIVIHAKSGGDNDGYIRRQYDAKLLKDSLDAYYSNDRVILIGDYNDRVVTSIYTGHVSSYQPFVDDVVNYDILTKPLDQAGKTSFPGSTGMIDHITITNDLVNDYIPNSTDIEDPRVYIANYNSVTASDHLPVISRFQFCKLTCPTNIAVSNTMNQCGANVNFSIGSTFSCGTVTAVPASGSFFPIGTTTVNVSASNGETCSFTVTVVDSQNPVITSCPSVPVFCYATSGNYTIPAITATDNCPTLSFSYSISGATTRSGTTNNASGSFNPGTSMIAWTATDGAGNTATCQTTVVVNPSLTVTIPDAYALSSGTLVNTVYIGYAPASSITMSSMVSGGTPGYSYNWSSGSTASTATVSPLINTTYNLTVTDQQGCEAMTSKEIKVIDVRSGKKLDKVNVCHNGYLNLSVSPEEAAIHLSHGDMLGVCGVTSGAVTKTSLENEISKSLMLTIAAMPNPSTKSFSLNVVGDADSKMLLRIIDVFGRIMEVKSVTSGQTISIGDNYRTGVYFAELMQGNKKEIVKLIKIQ